jgi:cation:H+ antiporter
MGGLLLLYVGGEVMVGAASRLALRLRLSPLAVGLTVVAFGTSAPELVVSIDAALGGLSEIAIANVVGSNICNVALILGLSALVAPIAATTRIVRFDVPVMIAASLLALGLLADGRIGRLDGVILLLGLLGFAGFNLWRARREAARVPVQAVDGPGPRRLGLPADAVLVVVGLGGLVVGADLFLGGAVGLARLLGASEALIGLTIVAVGTSLPELFTSVLAAWRGHGDIALGNVLGSNVFNVLGILGGAGLVRSLERGGVSWADIAVMLAVSLLLLPLLRSGYRLSRIEGALGLLVYAGYLTIRSFQG